MPVACVLVHHLSVKIELQRQPALRGQPVLVVERAGQRKIVLDHSPEAPPGAKGLRLEQALARCPRAAIIEADMPAYQDAWGRVLDALEQRSPVVEDAGLGTAYTDLTGLAGLYGSEAGLVAALLKAVPALYSAQVGVASGKFPAYTAATVAPPGGARKAPEDVAGFLAPLSIDLLPVSGETRMRLRGFGLDTLGAVARLPLGPLQAQFGREGTQVWELARGIDPSPLVPRKHQATVAESLAFSAPVMSLETIATALDVLLGRAFAQPIMRGRFARQASVGGPTTRGPSWHKRLGFAEPVGTRQRGLFVLRHAVERYPPPGPLAGLALELSGLTGESGRQGNLFVDVREEENLRGAIRDLEARLGGPAPIYQVREAEPWSRIPERRRMLVPYVP